MARNEAGVRTNTNTFTKGQSKTLLEETEEFVGWCERLGYNEYKLTELFGWSLTNSKWILKFQAVLTIEQVKQWKKANNEKG